MSTTTLPSPNGAAPPTAAGVLTLAEAAELLRVSADGLKADAVANRVPGRLIAGEWRFQRDALLAWLGAANKPAKVPPPASVRDETPEEQEAFLNTLREIRKSWGKVGGDEDEASG